jgi:hypothetical protein
MQFSRRMFMMSRNITNERSDHGNVFIRLNNIVQIERILNFVSYVRISLSTTGDGLGRFIPIFGSKQ